jgi:hypothetical protein
VVIRIGMIREYGLLGAFDTVATMLGACGYHQWTGTCSTHDEADEEEAKGDDEGDKDNDHDEEEDNESKGDSNDEPELVEDGVQYHELRALPRADPRRLREPGSGKKRRDGVEGGSECFYYSFWDIYSFRIFNLYYNIKLLFYSK